MSEARERFEHGVDTVSFRVDLDGDYDDEFPPGSYLDCDVDVEWWLDRGYTRDANGDGLPGAWEDERELAWVVVRRPTGEPILELDGEAAGRRWSWLACFVDKYLDVQEALRLQENKG